MSMTYQALVII